MQHEESHPWKWFAPEHSKTLIVGTFPTAKRNWKYDFYYPNTANLFWKIMAHIANTELHWFSGEDAVRERKAILEKLSVAVTDMGNRVIRIDGSSLDENIIAIEYMDIFRILDENPEIQTIIFTSSSGKSSAVRWFSEFLKSRSIVHRFPTGKKPILSEIIYNGRTIRLVIGFSPSPRASNRISFENLVEIYRSQIMENIQSRA
jgi:G:T/U-mismatch repair DNA glycosylase